MFQNLNGTCGSASAFYGCKMKLSVRFLPFLATVAGCVFVSCDKPAQAPVVAASPGPVSSRPSTEAWITASPNPIPGSTGQGTTTIKWHSGGSTGAVYIGQNSDAIFADAPDGSQDAPWVSLSSS